MIYDINPVAPRPSMEAFNQGWRETTIKEVTPSAPAIIGMERALISSRDLGGARAAQFKIDSTDPVAWTMARNQLDQFDFFQRFFSHPVVLEAMPEAANARTLAGAFEMEEPFTTFGRLAGVLAAGGAYKNFAGTDTDVRELVSNFVDTAVGLNVHVRNAYSWVSWRAWSPWFCDVASDASFFWFDRNIGVATVLISTDTD